MNVFSWFVMNLKFVVFLCAAIRCGTLEKWGGCGIAGGCFTDIMVHSSMSYHY